MRVVVRSQAPACMLYAWRASNLLDSMTDAYYAGESPSASFLNDVRSAIERLKECSVPPTKVNAIVETLEEVRQLNAATKLDEAKAKAGQARSSTQKLLEGFALQTTL